MSSTSTSLLDQAKTAGYQKTNGKDVGDGEEFPVLATAKISGAGVEITKVEPHYPSSAPGSAPGSGSATGSATVTSSTSTSTAVTSSAAAAPLKAAITPKIADAKTKVDAAIKETDLNKAKPLVDAAVTGAKDVVKDATNANTTASDTGVTDAITEVNNKVTDLENALNATPPPIDKTTVDPALDELDKALEALNTALNTATAISGGKKSSKTQRRRMRKYRGSAKRRNRSGKRV